MGNKIGKNRKATPTASREYTTEWSTHEMNIVWKIQNFSALKATKEFTSLKFHAGACINQRSTWQLEFWFRADDEMGIDLELKKSWPRKLSVCGLKKPIYAIFHPSIKDPNDPGRNIVSFKRGVKNYSEELNWSEQMSKFVTLEQLRTSGALVNDCLAIHVNFVLFGKKTACTTSVVPCRETLCKNAVHDEMANHFRNLLETGEGSDFVIRAKEKGKLDSQGHERKVHRAILSARSPVFKAMLEAPMLEKESGIVGIGDLSLKGLDILLEFIYTGGINKDWTLVPVEVVNFAEKYNLPLLQTYCDQWLHTACSKENAFMLLNLANKHKFAQASKNISHFIQSNLKTVLTKV